jgi:hypothetical protein
MLHANGIVPRNPEPHQVDTPPSPAETSSGKRERSELEVKEEVESELEADDEDGMREKALLVRFYISNLLTSLSLIMLG